MPNHKVKILSTKRLDEMQINQLSSVGEVFHFDLLKTIELKPAFQKNEENIIFTSYKGAQIGLKLLGDAAKNHKYFCVGEKTREMLSEKGLILSSFADYSSDLAQAIIKNSSHQKFTYLCNQSRLDILPDLLRLNEVKYNEIHTYKSDIDLTSNVNEYYHVYMWYSPLGVGAMKSLKGDLQEAQHICIGKTTAKALEELVENKNNIWSPDAPSTDAMVNHVLHLFS